MNLQSHNNYSDKLIVFWSMFFEKLTWIVHFIIEVYLLIWFLLEHNNKYYNNVEFCNGNKVILNI